MYAVIKNGKLVDVLERPKKARGTLTIKVNDKKEIEKLKDKYLPLIEKNKSKMNLARIWNKDDKKELRQAYDDKDYSTIIKILKNNKLVNCSSCDHDRKDIFNFLKKYYEDKGELG